ncbi:LacI family transcriptional regulator [Enterococcus sp. JM4C]|uniref:LacI family DNA-binding transcriptional regulator n=1 Tax=Candidatus Enterococcus huntleyi TaxID=1857217 RepID=UPI001379520C|nr:LacI family DNA-binding transcriptional regulator [Enterococcus sp. JM4C]KAF1297134.1 LacI family transcriptional regulator [Enterococcus sp. JM4C]
MATIQEVAKYAGVSVGSVSRYLNGYTLKADNMSKIMEAIAALDYRENLLAKGLKSNQSLSVGLLVNNMGSNFSSTLVAKIAEEMERAGYSLLLSGFQGDPEQVQKKIDFMLSRSVDGLILFEVEQHWPEIQALKELDLPVLSINTPVEFEKVDSILVNNQQSTKEVILRMLHLGHEKMGIIAAPQKDYVAQERLSGVLAAYEEAGISTDNLAIYYGDYSKESGIKGATYLLNEEKVSALFVCNYNMSLGALQVIYEAGLQLGQDLSFASYDYFEASEIFTPKLTVIKQPILEIGTLAANRMIERIQQKNQLSGETLVLNNEVLWRDSIAQK